VAVRSKASGRQTATRVWGKAGGVIRHQQRRRRPRQSAAEATGVNRRQRTDMASPFADSSMPTSVLAQISGREISRREIFLEPENFFRDSSRSRLVNIPTVYTAQLSVCCQTYEFLHDTDGKDVDHDPVA